MTAKQKSQFKQYLRQFGPYVLATAVVLGFVIVGSTYRNGDNSGNLNMVADANKDYNVSTDQLTEMYVVANLSNSLELASTEAVSSNYVKASVMTEIGQSNAEKLEKPAIVDTSGMERGVRNYVVKDGDTVASIAEANGLSADQVRWSNGLKTEDVTPGQTLKLPCTSGIVYTTKSGDTLDSIASKTGSNKDDIAALNDLEGTSAPAEGTQLVIPNGTLPETERPEYVAPSARSRNSRNTASTNTNTYTYTYLGSTSDRANMRTVGFFYSLPNNGGNTNAAGQCTWYAWWWRKNDGASLGELPSGSLGNASGWARSLAAKGYRVDHTPQTGAVFQTTSGYYGHVGVVTGINGDGSITVREMNYGRPYRVTESTIPANIVRNFNYIH